MKIVEFSNGKYGVQTDNEPVQFMDLKSKEGMYFWDMGSRYFPECQGSLEECEKRIQETIELKKAKVVKVVKVIREFK